MFSVMLALLAFVLSVVLTGLIRRYALKKNLLAIPNKRSSHEVPTPCGGGFAIVVSFLFSLYILYVRESISQHIFLTFFVGGSLVGLIGLADDFYNLRASLRIVVHFVASAVGLYLLGGFSSVVIGHMVIDFGMAGNFLGLIFLIWLLNLFNFMDGIDGIAVSETMFIACGAALIIGVTGGGESCFLLLLFAAACAGFMVWNWPPAKIFMGDVGSGFIGITLGFFIVMTIKTGELSFNVWLILSGYFLTDATVTLLRRMVRGDRWYEAHRSHAYQILSRRFGSHRIVTLMTLLLNVIWLFPLAYLSSVYPGRSLLIIIIAFLPMLCGVYSLGAGKENC